MFSSLCAECLLSLVVPAYPTCCLCVLQLAQQNGMSAQHPPKAAADAIRGGSCGCSLDVHGPGLRHECLMFREYALLDWYGNFRCLLLLLAEASAYAPAGGLSEAGAKQAGSKQRDAAEAAAAQPIIDLTEDDAAVPGCQLSPASRDTWACPACTLVNSSCHSACAACGASGPAGGGGGGGSSSSDDSRKQLGVNADIRLGLDGSAISPAGTVSPPRSNGSSRQQRGSGGRVTIGLGAGGGSGMPGEPAAGGRDSLHGWCCRF